VSFSYDFTSAPLIANVRLLISDTQAPGIFSDEEITAFYNIQASQFQSSQFYSYPVGRNLPASPVSFLRVAALALSALASNQSRLASITQLLDVHLAPGVAAKALRDQAAEYRAIDDDAGAFAVIEQVNTSWNMRDRFWAQVQRQGGGAIS
jgi:hypothetical protein